MTGRARGVIPDPDVGWDLRDTVTWRVGSRAASRATSTRDPGVHQMTVLHDAMTASHACAVPVSDEQLWEMTARFLSDGLAAGEHVVYFGDGTADAVLERLDDDGVSVTGPLHEGRLTILSSETTRSVLGGTADELLTTMDTTIGDALGRGFPAVRLTGDSSYALSLPDPDKMLRFEAAVDGMLADRPAKILCFYDQGRFTDDEIASRRALHHTELSAPAVYDDSLLRITMPRPSWARVAGEVDHSNRPRIKQVLEAALDATLRSHSSAAEITLDLSSLRFLDVAGAVSLVHAAEEFPSTHLLVLTGVRPGVLRLLDRCGAPFAAQLRVEPRAARS